MFLGANTLECESSREQKFPGHFALGSESSRERKGREWMGQGAKGPRSKSSMEQFGQGPIGRFAPGSEFARERKGCESKDLTCALASGLYNINIAVVTTLITKPANVIAFGAHDSGICRTIHFQKCCIKGSISDTPVTLYLCSASLFSCDRDKISFPIFNVQYIYTTSILYHYFFSQITDIVEATL